MEEKCLLGEDGSYHNMNVRTLQGNIYQRDNFNGLLK